VTDPIEVLPIRRALIAVANKDGLAPFAARLAVAGVRIVSTGNTARVLADQGVPVTQVAEVTGFPEMLGGRVKTLHPGIHAGVLADKRNRDHLAQLTEQGIDPFDLVVVNLYRFRETVAAGAAADDVIEQIDIGGPAIVRAAAKNFESVAVLVDPTRYESIAREIEGTGGIGRANRRALAADAFAHTAAYEGAIADWFGDQETGRDEARSLPVRLHRAYEIRGSLRYGENPHQRGALYAVDGRPDGPLGGAEVLQGKEMSFNNWLDADAARALAALFDPGDEPVAVITKHNNPCGVAIAPTLAEAYRRAFECDQVSAFGGIVAFNGPVDEAAALAMKSVFTEVVIAPDYSEEALAIFAARENLRVLRAPLGAATEIELRRIDGGALGQDADTVTETRDGMPVVTTATPTVTQWRDLLFAWKVAAKVRSNAIVFAKDGATVGIGAGQMNRVIAVDIAARQAGDKADGAAMASDAFFPFPDGIERAVEAGIAAVIQPGGSVRDEEVLRAAEEHGMAMVYTGRRHFRH
jgi:phosphoribosylaminoimidazolecarboxamide formyltransferase/IMP cyclohydrolase